MTNTRQHGLYSPSQADRVFLCPGSNNQLARIPKRDQSVYASEGEKAHTILELAINNGWCDAQTAHREYSPYFAEDLHNGYNYFYTAVNEALEYIKEVLSEDPASTLYVETKVHIFPKNMSGAGISLPEYDFLHEETAGHCDIGKIQPTLRRVVVIDYKHGAGVAVTATDNRQMKQYGGGFVFDERGFVSRDDVDTVELIIIQPRAFSRDDTERSFSTDVMSLHQYGNELLEAIEKAEQPDAPLVPGDKQCQFCDANPTCPAREAMALNPVQNVSTIAKLNVSALPNGDEVDLVRLSMILQAAPALRDWLNKAEDYGEELLRHGHRIPGKKLVEASPKRTWHLDEEETAKNLAAIIGVPIEDVMRESVLTITEAEKRVVASYKKGVARNKKKERAEAGRKAFAYLTTKKTTGKISMVDESDPRPAVGPATKVFAGIKINPPVIGETT